LWFVGFPCGEESDEMFERFTDRAQRVIVLAQIEARARNRNYLGPGYILISPEHILLDLIHESSGMAVKTLKSLGISLDAIRQQVEEVVGNDEPAPSGQITLTPLVTLINLL
jgi:ATP-dependent Clp protease ATP-binding subunit ClpC